MDSPSQHTSVANSSLDKSEASLIPTLQKHPCYDFGTLTLSVCCAHNPSHCESMYVFSLSCLVNSVLDRHTICFRVSIAIILPPFFDMIPKPWGERLSFDVLFGSYHSTDSYSLYVDWGVVSILIVICSRILFWWGLSDVITLLASRQIFGGSWMLGPFNKVIVPCFLLGLMS